MCLFLDFLLIVSSRLVSYFCRGLVATSSILQFILTSFNTFSFYGWFSAWNYSTYFRGYSVGFYLFTVKLLNLMLFIESLNFMGLMCWGDGYIDGRTIGGKDVCIGGLPKSLDTLHFDILSKSTDLLVANSALLVILSTSMSSIYSWLLRFSCVFSCKVSIFNSALALYCSLSMGTGSTTLSYLI